LSKESVEALKDMLCLAPVLRSPDFFRPFFVQCDASKSGVGGVLDQKTDEGDEFPIAFVSKKLSKAQKNYSVTVQECLAAIVCIKRFWAYMMNSPDQGSCVPEMAHVPNRSAQSSSAVVTKATRF